MKPVFLKSIGRLGKGLLPLFILAALMIPSMTQAAGISLWKSSDYGSTFTTPPQIDATNFLNTGIWDITTPTIIPFQTKDTVNYTNENSMTASIGWEFDHGPLANGVRGWSGNFYNDNNATVAALDGSVSYFVTTFPESFLWISATNIINKGLLQAGGGGEMKLTGQNVLLSHSLLEITPIESLGDGAPTADNGITDEYWAQTNATINSRTIWNGVTAASPTFNAAECGGTINTAIDIAPSLADSYVNNVGVLSVTATNMDMSTTNYLVPTNIVHQAVFVVVNDPNITAADRFSPSLISTNPFQTVAVQLTAVSTNVITFAPETESLLLIDDLASSTNGGLTNNPNVNPFASCTATTAQPLNYILRRNDQADFVGAAGAGSPPADFLYGSDLMDTNAGLISSVSNTTVTAKFAAYSALATSYLNYFSGNVSNAPGRIRIYAHDLDISKARMRGESEILIQATNLISSAGALIDCPNLSYNLGSTNGFLNVTNLVSANVSRLNGTISVWSGVWSNQIQIVLTNNWGNTTNAATTNAVLTQIPLTNSAILQLAVTIVDASGLSTGTGVTVQDLILHSTNMIVSDSATVANSLLFDGTSLTLLGNLTLSGSVQSWNYTEAPSLRFFTNEGTLYIPQDAHFGDDGTTNYAAFVNQGNITSGNQIINADYLEISGPGGIANETFADDFSATCQTGVVVNVDIFSDNNIQFFATSLRFKQATLLAYNTLDFTVTNLLDDGGFTANNLFECQNGFNLFVKPIAGDLLGTTIDDIPVGGPIVDHVWAGNDYGTNAIGYSNNVAIGTLALITNGIVVPGYGPLFEFTGAGADNGLYVSNLDLSMLDDYADEIQIDPNITIYFVSAEVNTNNVDITGFPDAEHFLNGQFNSHLQWVPGGLGGAVKTMLSGSYSQPGGNGRFQIQLNDVPSGQTNIIEASTNLVNWIPIYTNIGSMTFTDSAATNFPSRFYRTRTLP